jgi:hypothetical protein
MYTPGLPDEVQCSGYILLKKMVMEKITPASHKAVARYLKDGKGLMKPPQLKHLYFLHPLLRPFVIDHWDVIRKLPL